MCTSMWIASRFGKQTFPAWLFLLSNRALFPTYLWSQSVFSCDSCMCITLKIFAKWNSRVHRFTEWFFLASDFLEEAKSGRKQWSPLWGWHTRTVLFRNQTKTCHYFFKTLQPWCNREKVTVNCTVRVYSILLTTVVLFENVLFP